MAMTLSLNVFFTIDKSYVRYFTVALTSLLENNKHLDLNVYLIHSLKDDAPLREIVRFTSDNYQRKLTLLFQDESVFKDYTISKHVSVSTYFRLLLPRIIPEHVEEGLFIDSDTVIIGPLDELAILKFAAIDEQNPDLPAFLYAVSEITEYKQSESARLTNLGFPTEVYFNAGVMLISLKNWRLANATKGFMTIAEKYMDHLIYWDQDVLNMYFANRWKALNPRFNALHLIWKRATKPVIIHFVGDSKPWNYLNRHPYKREYFKYLSLTPFRSETYADFSYKQIIYKYYKDTLHFLNYFRQRFLGNLETK